MRKVTMLTLLLIVCIPYFSHAAQKSKKEPEWKTGKVLDSRVAKSS